MVQQLADILTNLVNSAAGFVPNLVQAIILLVIGLVIGKIVGRVVKEVLVRVKVDYYIHETHKPPMSVANLFSIIARWWIYLAFITAALSQEILGIAALSAWVSSITAFIPNIIGASIIVVVGYVVGEWIKSTIVKTGHGYSAVTGKLLFFFILYVSIALALPVLGISATLVNTIMLAIIAAISGAFILAFGLGGREVAGAILRKWARKGHYT